jgi:hypothetical protein
MMYNCGIILQALFCKVVQLAMSAIKKTFSAYAGASQKQTESESRAQKHRLVFAVLLFLGLVAFSFFFNNNADRITFDIRDDAMIIKGPDSSSYAVRYGDIVAMTLVDGFDSGDLVSGYSTAKFSSGIWRNREFGEYSLCVQNNVAHCIIVATADHVTVFNFESDAATDELHSAIMSMLA